MPPIGRGRCEMCFETLSNSIAMVGAAMMIPAVRPQERQSHIVATMAIADIPGAEPTAAQMSARTSSELVWDARMRARTLSSSVPGPCCNRPRMRKLAAGTQTNASATRSTQAKTSRGVARSLLSTDCRDSGTRELLSILKQAQSARRVEHIRGRPDQWFRALIYRIRRALERCESVH